MSIRTPNLSPSCYFRRQRPRAASHIGAALRGPAGLAGLGSSLRSLAGAASLLCGLVVLGAACEGPSGAACRQYDESFRALACTEGLTSGVDCAAFADHPCDLTPYFQCLSEGQSCDAQGNLLSDVSACEVHLRCGGA